MPNGIETSADGRLVFLNGSGEVRRIVRATGEVEARVQLGGLDNARWASDGRLVVANLTSETQDGSRPLFPSSRAGPVRCRSASSPSIRIR